MLSIHRMKLVHILGLLLVLTHGSVLSATIHVPADQPTIQAGIDAALTGDTVLVDDGVYTGERNRDVDFGGRNIVLISRGGPEVTIIDCQQAGRAFYFHSGEDSTASIRGFTIKNGVPPADTYTGGGIHCENSSPSIIDCIFSNNVAATHICPVYGGAVYAFGSTTHLSKCVFQDNAVWDYDLWGEGWGGAIAAQQSMLTIDTCLFIGNRAEYGGALFASESSELAVENCTFYANRTGFEDAGSTLFLGNRFGPDMSTATLEKCIITYGLLSSAIQCSNSANLASLACCNVFGNAGGDWIGCIADQVDTNGNLSSNPLFCAVGDGNLFLSNSSSCAPENNDCNVQIGAFPVGCYSTYRVWNVDSDGGGDAPSIQAALDSSTHGDTIRLSDGVYSGAGNYNVDFKGKLVVLLGGNGGDSTIIDCDSMGRGFTFNDAEDRNAIVQDVTIRSGLEENGGGILCDVLASPTILRCRFEQNSATYRGGAASIAPEASPKFVDCEFIQNISLDHGGAVNTGYTSSPEFYGCTFEANRGDRGGAASFGGEALLDGCTFSDNEATVGGGAIGVYGSGDLVTLQNCTVVDNSAGLGGGVYLFYGSISLVNTLICFSTEGEAVYNAAHGSALASCCNVFGNAGGDWVGALEGQLGENANIAEPPFLCDTGSADYHLMPWSPCVPDNNSCGQLIGAVSLGCNCVIRGDINHDGNPTVDISDLVYLVDFMFTSGDALPCIDESDVNADGATDIADLVYVVDFMFNSGPAPVPCP